MVQGDTEDPGYETVGVVGSGIGDYWQQPQRPQPLALDSALWVVKRRVVGGGEPVQECDGEGEWGGRLRLGTGGGDELPTQWQEVLEET